MGMYLTENGIQQIADEIAALVKPDKIIVFNAKSAAEGITSFKLCVVLDTKEKGEAERRIYVNVDTPVPFDVILYTLEEWGELSRAHGSFANKVAQTGRVIYG